MLAVVSVVLMSMVTAITIDPAQDVRTPLEDIYLVRLEQGRFAPNLGTLAGLSPLASLALLATVMAAIGWRITAAGGRGDANLTPEQQAQRENQRAASGRDFALREE